MGKSCYLIDRYHAVKPSKHMDHFGDAKRGPGNEDSCCFEGSHKRDGFSSFILDPLSHFLIDKLALLIFLFFLFSSSVLVISPGETLF